MTSTVRTLINIYRALDPRQRAVAILAAERADRTPDDALFAGLQAREHAELARLLALARLLTNGVGRDAEALALCASELHTALQLFAALQLAGRYANDHRDDVLRYPLDPSASRAAVLQRADGRLKMLDDAINSLRLRLRADLQLHLRRLATLDLLITEVADELGCDPLLPPARDLFDAARAHLIAVLDLFDTLMPVPFGPLPGPDDEALDALRALLW